jgi:(2Fe-2S) ferredoxin
MNDDEKLQLQTVAQSFGIGRAQKHVFLCIGKPLNADGTQPPACCSREDGLKAWKHLQNRLAELGLTTPKGNVHRTKAECLRLCQKGPIAVVYPEGTWYGDLTPENIDRLIESHLKQGATLNDCCCGEDDLRRE